MISDHGPEADHPEETESGHGGQCPRLAAAIAAWNAMWDAEAGHNDERRAPEPPLRPADEGAGGRPGPFPRQARR